MKKYLLLIIIALAFIGCKKDKDCNCGIIANDGITNGCYWLEIRNDCSGNKKKFCFDQDIWMSNYVGDPFCVTNQPAW
jgi:hypothetical protein